MADRLEHVLDEIRALPRVTTAISVGGTLNPRDWLDFAERGFFAYDWSHAMNRYQLEAPFVPGDLDVE